MAKREMTGDEMIAFLEESGFKKVSEKDEKSALLKGSFAWPSCFKSTAARKPRKKITGKKQSGLKNTTPKRAVV